jgi:hypothetical protein
MKYYKNIKKINNKNRRKIIYPYKRNKHNHIKAMKESATLIHLSNPLYNKRKNKLFKGKNKKPPQNFLQLVGTFKSKSKAKYNKVRYF